MEVLMEKQTLEKQALEKEWVTLQNQFDSYEKWSLVIKLAAVLLLLTAHTTASISIITILLLFILWGQDSIWKTFQSRIETRLLSIEKAIAENESMQAFQFNQVFLANRKGSVGLIVEYAKHSLRPTIAYPHCFLVLVAAYLAFYIS